MDKKHVRESVDTGTDTHVRASLSFKNTPRRMGSPSVHFSGRRGYRSRRQNQKVEKKPVSDDELRIVPAKADNGRGVLLPQKHQQTGGGISDRPQRNLAKIPLTRKYENRFFQADSRNSGNAWNDSHARIKKKGCRGRDNRSSPSNRGRHQRKYHSHNYGAKAKSSFKTMRQIAKSSSRQKQTATELGRRDGIIFENTQLQRRRT